MNKISIKDISRSLIFMMAFALIFVFLARGFAVGSSSSEDGMESRITTAYRGEARNSLDVIFTGAYRLSISMTGPASPRQSREGRTTVRR